MINQNKNADLLGVACMCVGVCFLTISDSLAKWFSGAYPPIQLIFIRAVISFPLIAIIAFIMGKHRALQTTQLSVHLFRGFVSVASACTYYWGIQLLPFADVTAIGYASPLFIAVLSAWWFKEKISAKTIGAILVGFLGVIAFARPNFQNGIELATLLPLVTAFGYAVLMMSAKRLTSGDLINSMFFLAMAQLIFSSLVVPWFWESTHTAHYWGFLAIAICSALGLGLITQAFKMAPASVVAPYDYTAIIWAIFIGWFFWGEVPDFWSYVGVVLVTCASCAIIFERARLLKKSKA